MLSSAWVCLSSSCFGGISYVPLLNNSIAGKAVAIWPDNLACHVGRLRSQVATATSGKRKMPLGELGDVHYTHLASFAPGDEVESMCLTQSCRLAPFLSLSWMHKYPNTLGHVHTHTHASAHPHARTHTHAQNMSVGLQENSTVQGYATANHWFRGSVVL